ncbi:MAG: hypothetical protein ACPLRN_03810, partial [Microgenomates group bacterium]
MKGILKAVFFVLVLLVLLVLSPFSVKADVCNSCTTTDCCGFNCSEECSPASGSCSGNTRYGCSCVCGSAPTKTPTPRPTNTPKPGSSPTAPPDIGGTTCQNNTQCQSLCLGIPNCTAVCLNGHCYTTNLTAVPSSIACNIYGGWQCLSGQSACAACASEGYTCAVRYCDDPPNSNQYQITCGCPLDGGGGGGTNPTNTPIPTNTLTPTNTPTPSPTPIIRWIKIKDTSFYTNKNLNNPLPATVAAYDTDDDGTRYFIIASTSSDPGLVAAASIYLNEAPASTRAWTTTSATTTFRL